MARSVAWKGLEKTTAEILGGIRVHRGGDFSESLPDVIAPAIKTIPLAPISRGLVVECKYRAGQTWIEMYKALGEPNWKKNFKYKVMYSNAIHPLNKKKDTLVFIPLTELKEYFTSLPGYPRLTVYNQKKVPTYLSEYCAQSRQYIDDLDIRDQVQLLYYRATKDRTVPPFSEYSSMAVIGQKNDKLRLAYFYLSEFSQFIPGNA